MKEIINKTSDLKNNFWFSWYFIIGYYFIIRAIFGIEYWLIYAFAIFAYAAFDKVLVGLIYSLIISIISINLFLQIKNKYLEYPVITYTTLTYTIGTLAALVVRLLR